MIKKWIKRLAREEFTSVHTEVAKKKTLKRAEAIENGLGYYKFDFSQIHTTKDIIEVLQILDSKLTLEMDSEEVEKDSELKKYLTRTVVK